MGGGWREGIEVPVPLRCFCFRQELFYEDRHFHEGCFRCCRCQRSLADEPFTCQDSELLCNDCYCSAFSSQCSACGETVMPGTSPGAPGVWDRHAWPLCRVGSCMCKGLAPLSDTHMEVYTGKTCTGSMSLETQGMQDLLCLYDLGTLACIGTGMHRDWHAQVYT